MKLIRRMGHGFTLVEMMMALGSGSVVLASVVIASVALQRSFAAVETYSITEGDQLRVLDYIALDCRRALTAQVSSNTLTLTLPVYYNSASNNVPNTPALNNGILAYGSGSVTVTYAQSGGNFNRQVVIKDSGGTTTSTKTTAIATNVASFTVTAIDLTSSLSCSIMFFPTFRYTSGNGTWRAGAAAPSDALGSDGDLYVVDATATDTSTTGNVYRRASGVYTLLQNVKATSVYCNTFLRNASARQ
jgi:Tfp pilus assembly protein PilW